MSSIHDGHRQRTKEEFMARPDSFPDHKLLELLMFYTYPRKDVNPTAHMLMERFGSFDGVLDALPEELERAGLSRSAVVLLKVVKESSRRYLTDRCGTDNIVGSVREAVEIFRPYFFGAREERAYLMCMDGKRRCLGVWEVGSGDVNNTLVNFRRVAEAALAVNAARVVLAHNHVSGIALPSVADRLATAQLEQKLETLGIVLEDHIIIANDDAVSLRESGWVQ